MPKMFRLQPSFAIFFSQFSEVAKPRSADSIGETIESQIRSGMICYESLLMSRAHGKPKMIGLTEWSNVQTFSPKTFVKFNTRMIITVLSHSYDLVNRNILFAQHLVKIPSPEMCGHLRNGVKVWLTRRDCVTYSRAVRSANRFSRVLHDC